MNQDSYFIGKKDGALGLGVSLINKAEVYKEANAFCSKKSLEVQVLREVVTPAKPARLGSTELHFKCVEPGGSAKPLEKEADNPAIITPSSNADDKYTKLRKLKLLLDDGIITQKEFETEKKKILAQ